MQAYWIIRGYEGTKIIYEKKVKAGLFSDNKMQELLKALVAKKALTDDETVGAYVRKGVRMKNDLLHVHFDAKYHTFSCGNGTHVHFVAHTVTEEK